MFTSKKDLVFLQALKKMAKIGFRNCVAPVTHMRLLATIEDIDLEGTCSSHALYINI